MRTNARLQLSTSFAPHDCDLEDWRALRVATWEGLPGKPTSILKLPSGHSFTDLLIVDGVLYFSIYINDGYLIAQEAKTGTDKWRFKVKGLGISARRQ